MTDDYYGWKPISYPMYAGVSDDYAADRAAQATPYQPTDWNGVTIETMWEYVRNESDSRTTALADMWRRAADLLQATRDNLKRHADSLDARWSSPAARVFMSRVGATLHSLDEWKEVANRNAAGLDQLATKISSAKRDMRELWLQYKAEQEHQQQIYDEDKAKFTWGDFLGDQHKSYEVVQREFHQRAKNIAKPLADLYIDVYISNISRGGKFKGPIEAAVYQGGGPAGPGRPGAPGPRPGAPGLNGGRPGAPNRPNPADQPNRPDLGDRPGAPTPPPPGLPDGVGLAGGAAPTAPPGPAPAPPPVTTAPNAPVTPGPAVPPVTGPGIRPGAGPATPNSGARPNAPRATLPGAGSAPPPASRGPAPNRPTLPGAGAPGNGSGAPGGGRRGTAPNRPTLPGNTGAPGRPGLGARPGSTATPPPSSPRLPGSTARPGQRGAPAGRPAAPPPSLGGQRGTAAGTPAAGRPGQPPRQGTTPPGARGAGPGAPTGSGRGGLSGRTGTGRPAPTTGPGPSLAGRRGGPGPRTGAQRDPEQETWEYGDGDDELWATESSGTGAVEAPAEHRPREQGRALGQG
ncbi:WXG100-like domain-containing protein [Micromonospora radicis]|uniref:Outer membrane channel protein CpnT-like N-terminal domain-containing protein n=1 Tax=Micromonospora radicis TaxID=1894971 RepID=A0A418MP80_9ACTN|nr:hypothetical protein [Micromonospora radicis]RIV34348.1 hypothetical protein D2L64_23495 [Micromonospora radicis]